MSTRLVDKDGKPVARGFDEIEKELLQMVSGIAAHGLAPHAKIAIRVDAFLYLYRFFHAVALILLLAKEGVDGVRKRFPPGVLAPLMRTPKIREATDAVGDLRGDAPQPELRTGMLTSLLANFPHAEELQQYDTDTDSQEQPE